MSDRDRLASLLSGHLYDRGSRVQDWPEDERALQRDPNAWTSFDDRAEKVQRLRFEKAAAAILAEFLVVPRSDVGTEYGVRFTGEGGSHVGGVEERAQAVSIAAGHKEAYGVSKAEAVERPLLPPLPWSPIPLPEEGGSSE